jgi:hypothetical protein
MRKIDEKCLRILDRVYHISYVVFVSVVKRLDKPLPRRISPTRSLKDCFRINSESKKGKSLIHNSLRTAKRTMICLEAETIKNMN